MDELRIMIKALKALSDENRIRMIGLLKDKPGLCVCEITEIIGLSQPTISSHLKILEEAGFIEHRKVGLWVNYSISKRMDSEVRTVFDTVISGVKQDKQIKDDIDRLSRVDRARICSRTGTA